VSSVSVGAAADAAFRDEWGRVVATLIRFTSDWDLAEECAADAFAMALRRWPRDGVPDRPGAWLTTVARNRAIDLLRRRRTAAARLQELAVLAAASQPGPPAADGGAVPDDRLRLIFTCCHPALSLEARVALTLRTLAGLTTAQIARALMSSEATMAKRLVRAKQRIRDAGIPYEVPSAESLPERLSGVLGVLYLLFNEGYSAADLARVDLTAEAIRLARVLVQLLPDELEASGLLALMLLQDSRRAARVDADGELVTLEDQDRSLWDAASIAAGVAVLERAALAGRPGPYQLQAAIAACHAGAATAAQTDWPQIALLYAELSQRLPTPVVELNRAVAVAMASGPAAGLALVSQLESSGQLTGYYLLPAARADLLRRLGRSAEAATAYQAALGLAPTGAERRYLARRLAEVRMSI
jgi:RNA polymerase sigma-70 factor, ECF subfamily